MPYVNVHGVNLYYEEYGKGPAVILAPGGRVDCNGLRPIAALLDAIYTLGNVVETTQSQQMREQDLREHENIAQAAYQRDGAAAREALIAHFETTASRLGFRPLWRNLNGKESADREMAAHSSGGV